MPQNAALEIGYKNPPKRPKGIARRIADETGLSVRRKKSDRSFPEKGEPCAAASYINALASENRQCSCASSPNEKPRYIKRLGQFNGWPSAEGTILR